MKLVLSIAVLLFSPSAFAQDPPNVSNEQPVQVKPNVSVGCKALGTVEGRKLWAGDCVANAVRRRDAFAHAPTRNQARGPLVARGSKRTNAREPIDAGPPAEEKTWWNR